MCFDKGLACQKKQKKIWANGIILIGLAPVQGFLCLLQRWFNKEKEKTKDIESLSTRRSERNEKVVKSEERERQ